MDGGIEFLIHLPQQGRINFVFGGNNVENRLERLGFCAKTHRLMERFKSQFRVIGDVESDLRRAGFGLVSHTDFQYGVLP